MPEDQYQEQYIKHQDRKRMVLIEIMKARHSDRMFSDRDVESQKIKELISVVELCPSSCDRHAVSIKVITGRDEKALLGGILVGGVGWVHRAPAILLIIANPKAYKADGEIDFMPYLDGGVVVQQLGLATAAMGLAGCFVNPNIREINIGHFHKVFGKGVLCGAFAVGYPYSEKA